MTAMVTYAKRKVRAAARAAPEPVLFGRITLRHEPHRSIERPITVAVTLDVNGYPVHAHAAGRSRRRRSTSSRNDCAKSWSRPTPVTSCADDRLREERT